MLIAYPVALLAAAFLLWSFLRWYEWRNLYLPSRKIGHTPAEEGIAFEEITLVTADDHRLHAWWLPHPDAALTVLMCHGNGGNISDCIDRISDLFRMGVSVFIMDYRGYGKSRGLSTETGLYLDAEAAYEWIRTTQYANAETPPIVLYGHSLGGAVALRIALHKPAIGLILESTFTSIPELARRLHRVPPGFTFLINQRYDSMSRIARLRVPLLVAAGGDDTLVPGDMGRRLFEKAVVPKQFCGVIGDHLDSGWRTTPAYKQAVTEFLRQCEINTATPTGQS